MLPIKVTGGKEKTVSWVGGDHRAAVSERLVSTEEGKKQILMKEEKRHPRGVA